VVESDELAERANQLAEAPLSHRPTSLSASSDGTPTRERLVAVEVDGRRHEVRLHVSEPPWAELARRRRGRSAGLHGGDGGTVVSPMQGTVLAVEVAEGDEVTAGAVLCIVEAMKMENEIVAHRDGRIVGLGIAAGESVTSGQAICRIED
jgi:acetyl-CoA/propionyl-CoA carboxylase biotin carboxyl carrier protein